MQLIIFDIDGTLTQTATVDSRCFVRAVKDILGLDGIDTDWTTYRHVTDAGIAAELVERTAHCASADNLIAQLHDRFISLLTAEIERDASLCSEIPGASAMLDQLLAFNDVVVGLATGGWRASAELKLQRSGLDAFNLPLATSNDAVERESIIHIARQRVMARHLCDSFARQVYVGDGVWDARAARALGLDFIGVAQGEQAHRLLTEGARSIVKDYTDHEGFLRAAGLARMHASN